MFRRVLIANRGEIAVRIIQACRTLGIEAVAVYSEADRRALHVLAADEAVPIGPPPAARSYLNVGAILAAARATGVDAIHPGYGFLSENADFAEACLAAGFVFVGPPPRALRLLGDKAAARQLAASHSIPVVPGSECDSQKPAALLAAATAIGFPIMVKAVAGGGGRGMRLVAEPDELAAAIESAQREAVAAFGDGRLLLERAVAGARHVEVQLIADRHGNVVTLGERECSIQRRHQKIVEESPSPAVSPALRERLSAAAVRAARAAGYENAGTVEFLLDREGAFYFLEVNARLQVEHPVTELVAGVDLVVDQFRVAAGEPLAYRQEDVALSGQAIECRIVAEDPRRGYRPSPGRIDRLELPTGPHVRVDSGVAAGDDVSAHYDPLLAKVIGWGANRDEAIGRLARALDATVVDGVRTNLPLLRAVVAHPAFRAGDLSTDFLERYVRPADLPATPPVPVLLAAFGFEALGLLQPPADPWRALGPWRLGGQARVELECEGEPLALAGRRVAGTTGEWAVTVGSAERRVRFEPTKEDGLLAEVEGRHLAFRGCRLDDALAVTWAGRTYRLRRPGRPYTGPSTAPHRGRSLRAPMPGIIVKVLVEAGQAVRAHQPLVALEAMKMEHAIEAAADGVVQRVLCQAGQQVQEGELLVEVEAG